MFTFIPMEKKYYVIEYVRVKDKVSGEVLDTLTLDGFLDYYVTTKDPFSRSTGDTLRKHMCDRLTKIGKPYAFFRTRNGSVGNSLLVVNASEIDRVIRMMDERDAEYFTPILNKIHKDYCLGVVINKLK